MKDIFSYTKEELANQIKPSFRAKQIYNWIYQKYINSFEEMQNIPKELRKNLANEYNLSNLEIIRVEESVDKSKKYLFKLEDGLTVEAVLLPMKEAIFNQEGTLLHHAKYTICVSSQVGCKIGCSFCLTAKEGFKRDLTAGEIVNQVLTIKKENNIAHNRKTNIVFMGMGEPLDNIENVALSIKIFSDADGLSISPRRQTISTSGLTHQIKKLSKMNLGVLLAISLHAVDDEIREELMPINKAYNIKSIIDAIKEFPIDARKRVMFEYLLLGGVNDDLTSAKKLVKILSGIKAKVNLILFNPYLNSNYKRPTKQNAIKFQEYLINHSLLCTIRESKGLDISAACGQLKEKTKMEI